MSRRRVSSSCLLVLLSVLTLLSLSVPAAGAQLTFSTTSLPAQVYTQGGQTSYTLPAASGGEAPLSYTLTGPGATLSDPALPAGLTFDQTTRTLAGTPTVLQVATTYTYTVTDSADPQATTSLTLSIAVQASPDKAALEALYNATDGAKWKNNEHWNSAKPLADWYGVTTDANGRVTQLRLGNNGLVGGPIPPQLGTLTKLTQLRILENDLTGPIPPELGKLTELTHLRLYSNNDLTGPIPPELGKLTKLTNLYLHRNNLSGSIPDELANLTGLVQIWLNANELSGAIPT